MTTLIDERIFWSDKKEEVFLSKHKLSPIHLSSGNFSTHFMFNIDQSSIFYLIDGGFDEAMLVLNNSRLNSQIRRLKEMKSWGRHFEISNDVRSLRNYS